MGHAFGVTLACLWDVPERVCGEHLEDRRSRPDLASGRHHGSRYAADPAHKPASSVDAVRVPHGRRESAGD